MKILIVNDDGINSNYLKDTVKLIGEEFSKCYVVVPREQKSATSQCITIKGDLCYEEISPLEGSIRTIIVDGYPADCVRVAIEILKIDFDFVISGVNKGENLSFDLLYSGTVAAAREAAVAGFHSIALSASYKIDNTFYENLEKILHFIIDNKLYLKANILNVNIPNGSKGIKFAVQGQRLHDVVLTQNKNSSFNVGYKLSIPEEDKTKDQVLYNMGYTTITPLTYDQTDYQVLKKIKKIKRK